MTMYVQPLGDSSYLEHYGVPGMKWGVRKDRKSSGASRRQKKRDAKAQKYLDEANWRNARVDRSVTRKANKTAAKASKKIAKLERKASDANVRAEIVKERNADLIRRNAEYTRKPLKEKLKDRQTYDSSANFNRATKTALDSAVKKYGREQVSRIQRADTAKTAAIIGGLGAAGAAAYAYWWLGI